MLQAEPTVRVVIPAYRANGTIRHCVSAVEASANCFEHEIFVVDDGGNVDLEAQLQPFPVTILRTGGTGSAAAARNMGAHGFTQGVIVFVDADVVIEQDCIARLLEPIRSRQAEATIGNYTTDVEGLSFTDSYKQLYVACIYKRRAPYVRNDFWTAIGAIDAAVFASMGGFDDSFKGANGEDADLGCRLTRGNKRVLAVSDALGQHRHQHTIRTIFVNDWRKGVLAIRDCLNKEKALSENNHAKSRDVFAVFAAGAMLAASVAAPSVWSLWGLLLLILLTMAYFCTRADLISCFGRQGISFAVRATMIMFALDLVRGACVAYGVGLRTAEHLGKLRKATAREGSRSGLAPTSR